MTKLVPGKLYKIIERFVVIPLNSRYENSYQYNMVSIFPPEETVLMFVREEKKTPGPIFKIFLLEDKLVYASNWPIIFSPEDYLEEIQL